MVVLITDLSCRALNTVELANGTHIQLKLCRELVFAGVRFSRKLAPLRKSGQTTKGACAQNTGCFNKVATSYTHIYILY